MLMLILMIFHVNACVFQFQLSTNRLKQSVKTKLDSNMNKVYIIWTKYYPFIDDYSDFPVIYNGLIFREQDDLQKDILFYNMMVNSGKAYHYVTLQLADKKINQVFTLDTESDQYEGRWVMLYVFYNNQQAKIYLGFHANGNTMDKMQFNNFNGVQTSTQSYTIYDTIKNYYYIFQGYVQVIIPNDGSSYFTTAQQLYDALQTCLIPQQCVLGKFNQMNMLITSIQEQFQQQGVRQLYSDGYSISGWFIFTPKSKIAYSAYLFKLIQYGLEFDYSNGIQALTMYINYDIKNPQYGGVQVQTYSYVTPQWFEQLLPNNAILYTYFSQDYQNNIQKWTYFRYTTGPVIQTSTIPGTSITTNLNTEIFFSFSQSQYNIQFIIPKQLNQYKYGNLAVYLGNSPLTINPFIGQIANMQFTTCLTQYQAPSQCIYFFNQECHFSCFVCNGPSANNCLECPLNSNRILINNMCQCQPGFLQVDTNSVCLQIQQYVQGIQILTTSIKQMPGTCDQGYFFESLSQNCYQCPQQTESGMIFCGDCLDHPLDWQYRLNCTYDYQQFENLNSNAYYKVLRNSRNYDLYIFTGDHPDYTLTLFVGAQSYCQDLALEECNEVKFLTKTSYAVCASGYYYFQLNSNCQTCLQNCISCKGYLFCEQCDDNYYLASDKNNIQICQQCPNYCVGCKLVANQLQCISCRQGYSLQNNYSCQQCGINCKSCEFDYLYMINRCLVCNRLYYLMLDGINCAPISIPNCVVQYQEIDQQYLKVNTIRLNYSPQQQDQALTYCALCQDFYINNLTECKYFDSNVDQMQQGDQIIEFNGVKTYLKYSKDTSKQITPEYCYTIQYCNSCLQRGILYCVDCLDGYYPHIFNGQCVKCPSNLNCFTCYMENAIMEDQWKWNIRLFYQFRFKDQPDFIVTAVTHDINDYSIYCDSCLEGYELYNKQCILKCPETCASCIKVNNQNICSSCYSQNAQLSLSVYNNTCIRCPQNCILCQPRTQQQNNLINPYFNPDDAELQFYSYLCLKPSMAPNLFYNQNLGQYVECPDSQLCEKQVKFDVFYLLYQINGYCNDADFQQQVDTLTGTALTQFLQSNLKLSQLFSMSLDNHFQTVQIIFLYFSLKIKQLQII